MNRHNLSSDASIDVLKLRVDFLKVLLALDDPSTVEVSSGVRQEMPKSGRLDAPVVH